MLDRVALVTALRMALPLSQQVRVEAFADTIIASVANQAAAPQLSTYMPLLEALVVREQSMVVGGTVLSFGVGNDQEGATITVGDVAGGNVIKDNTVTITVPVTFATQTQTMEGATNSVQAIDSTVTLTTNISGDQVAGDKVFGDKILGDKNIHHHYPQATIDLAQAHELLNRMPTDILPELTPLPVSSLMPLSRNPLFVGRTDDLMKLARALKSGRTAAIGQIVAATGLGGIGKTNLATEFVHRYGQFFAGGVYWLSFANPAAVPAQIATSGGSGGMNLPGFDELKLDAQVARVQQEWSSATPRLLVFDNCEEEVLFDNWRPKTGGCRVLVTSRRSQWAASLGVMSLPLGVLSWEESVALMHKHRPDLGTDDASAIAQELGCLPLALHLAGSFLETYRDDPQFGSPADFLHELHDARLLQLPALVGEDVTPSPTNHLLHIGRTFALSYERLDSHQPADALAVKLLMRAAHFAPGEPIPRDLLLTTLELDQSDRQVVRQAAKGLVQLRALGLLEQITDGALRLHRLLAAFVLEVSIDEEAQAKVEQTLINAMDIRRDTAGYIASVTDIQMHVLYTATAALERDDTNAAQLAYWAGYYLRQIGDLAGARPYLERALAIRDQVLGPMHSDTATSLNDLGMLLQVQGDLQGARRHYERALVIREQVLGPMHPDTATSLNDLGALLQAQGDLQGARPYYERALVIQEQVLGPMHPDTATSLNNLGLLLGNQGDLGGARPYLERALAIYEQVLGLLHPYTATSLNNLGLLLDNQGDLAGARPYYEQALAIREQVLGPMHPYTAHSLNNLGLLLDNQGDLVGARRYYERALAIQEQVLGAMHSDTATSLNNLGTLLQAQGDLQGAQLYLERALAIHEQMLGPTHPDTAHSLNNLGLLLQAQGNLQGARQHYEQALAVYEQVLDPIHLDTAHSLNNLGLLLQAQGDLQGAQLYLERALAIREEVVGLTHPLTQNVRHNLAALNIKIDGSS